MKYFELVAVFIIGVGLGGAVLYLGHKAGQTRYGRGGRQTIQTLFSRKTFK